MLIFLMNMIQELLTQNANLIEHLFRIDSIAVLFASFNPFVEFILVEVELVTSFVVGMIPLRALA